MQKGRTCVHRHYPFTIIVKDQDVRRIENLPTYRVKIDLGSKATGIAVVYKQTNAVMLNMQIKHRGLQGQSELVTLFAVRRNKQSRDTRCRKLQPGNKLNKKPNKFSADSPRPEGWLPPTVTSVADDILLWIDRLSRWIHLTDCSFEAVRFDMQLTDTPSVSEAESQKKRLFGREVRKYILDKYAHTCQYCGGASSDNILETEHIVPKAKGGSDKVSI